MRLSLVLARWPYEITSEKTVWDKTRTRAPIRCTWRWTGRQRDRGRPKRRPRQNQQDSTDSAGGWGREAVTCRRRFALNVSRTRYKLGRRRDAGGELQNRTRSDRTCETGPKGAETRAVRPMISIAVTMGPEMLTDSAGTLRGQGRRWRAWRRRIVLRSKVRTKNILPDYFLRKNSAKGCLFLLLQIAQNIIIYL